MTKNEEYLNKIKNDHKIWKNPLLIACENGILTLDDFRYLFSQYYYYSKNFTKLLAACMVNCDDDSDRAKLACNLWDEGGGLDLELRHAEIFRKFLTKGLHLSLNEIIFEPYAKNFFNDYLDLCLNEKPIESAAALSFGTEGLVSRLYTILKQGLIQAGVSEELLIFFNIHIETDDDHAITLKEILFSHSINSNWLQRSEDAITKAMDLRDTFFTCIYTAIQYRKFQPLINRLYPNSISENDYVLKYPINDASTLLYQNYDKNTEINFSVNRLPFKSDVLDPRYVIIPTGFSNELHSHAHETVIVILSGQAEIIVGEEIISAGVGDVVFIPRWHKHQSKNTGENDLKFFAVTDYGLTKKIPENSETAYRLKKQVARQLFDA